jgi:acetyltransferase-like isoleucine patch superfamily enzyme
LVKIGLGVTVGSGVTIGDGAQVRAGSCIGEDCVLAEGVVISDFALVGNAVIGERSFIERGVVMTGFQKGRISIGRHCYVGVGDVLDWSGGLEMGDYVHVAGPATGIWTHSSVMSALKGKHTGDSSGHTCAAVKIGSRVWIGGSCTIYPGTVIESFSVVLPNSVVNAPVRSGTMVGGAPAVVKKTLKQEADGVTFSNI